MSSTPITRYAPGTDASPIVAACFQASDIARSRRREGESTRKRPAVGGRSATPLGEGPSEA